MSAVTDLESAFSAGVTTHVIGIQPSVFGPMMTQLNAMAVAGGAPQTGGSESFYLANDADELAGSIDDVFGAISSNNCTVALPEAPFTPALTQVDVGVQSYGVVTDCMTEDGFIYTNAENTEIELCGAACSDAALSVRFICDPG